MLFFSLFFCMQLVTYEIAFPSRFSTPYLDLQPRNPQKICFWRIQMKSKRTLKKRVHMQMTIYNCLCTIDCMQLTIQMTIYK